MQIIHEFRFLFTFNGSKQALRQILILTPHMEEKKGPTMEQSRTIDKDKLFRIWEYLWETYNHNGRISLGVADAISVVKQRIGVL